MSHIAKRMMLTVGICALAIIGICLPFGSRFSIAPFSLGVAMGCGLNVLKIYMLEQVVNKCTGSEIEKMAAANYIRAQYLLRLLLTGAVLVAAALIPHKETLWGAAAGVFTMQISVWFSKGADSGKKTQNSQ